jgi:dTDP-D-glucose 4,6-dehydratase
MVDTKAVSVRLPLDLLNELNTYATDKGMVRSGDANIGGAIIALLREHFGQSDNVKQVSDSVDIESIVNIAVESRLDAVLNQLENFRLDLHSIKTNDLITQNLQANLTVAQQRIEALEAIAAEKKSRLQLVKEEKKVA